VAQHWLVSMSNNSVSAPMPAEFSSTHTFKKNKKRRSWWALGNANARQVHS